MRTTAAIALVAITVLADCSPNRPEALARLARPTGLAYVSRTPNATSAEPQRADLMIADAEAQGVRVLQLETHRDEMMNEIATFSYLPAPAIYFPLVIPADGFPNKIALSEDGNRAYVIAPVTRMLYVLDVRQQGLGESPLSAGSTQLAAVALDEDMMLGAALPVGVAVVPNTKDVVLVAFDAVESGQGLIRVFRFNGDLGSATLDESFTETATVAIAPRDLIVHDGSALTTSAVTNFVSVLPVHGEAPYLGAAVSRDAGGPTGNVFDGGAGVFVTRLDRASVVLFESTAGLLDRSTRRIHSPNTPLEDRTSSITDGRVDLGDSPAISGAHGQVLQFDVGETDAFDLTLQYKPICKDASECPNGTVCQGPEELPKHCLAVPIDVVGIAQLDGRMSFLFGTQTQLAVIETSTVTALTVLAGQVGLAECGSTASVCSNGAAPPPVCEPGVVIGDIGVAQAVRATYRGTLATSKRATVGTSTIPGTVVLIDPEVISFVDHQVAPGDLALLSLELPTDCGAATETTFDYVFEARIDQVALNQLTLEVATSTAVDRLDCPDRWKLFSYEAYPSEDQIVVTIEAAGLTIARVIERVPVVHNSGFDSAQISKVVQGTLLSSGFTCTSSASTTEPCLEGSDCTNGTACEVVESCIGHCGFTACEAGANDCTALFPDRLCTSLEIDISRTAPYTLNLTSGAVTYGSPDDVVFSSQRRSFMVSFPSAKEVAEGYVDSGGVVKISHIR